MRKQINKTPNKNQPAINMDYLKLKRTETLNAQKYGRLQKLKIVYKISVFRTSPPEVISKTDLCKYEANSWENNHA